MTSVYCQNSLNNYVGRVQTAGHYSTCPKGWVYLRTASLSYCKDQPHLMDNHPPRLLDLLNRNISNNFRFKGRSELSPRLGIKSYNPF